MTSRICAIALSLFICLTVSCTCSRDRKPDFRDVRWGMSRDEVKKHETGVDEQSGIVLKNEDDEMAVVSLAMRAKMPKRGIVAGDLGYITVDEFPRADRATITYTKDGSVETIEAGVEGKALQYEVEAMNELVVTKGENWTLPLSEQVMELMDEARRQWGLTYDFE